MGKPRNPDDYPEYPIGQRILSSMLHSTEAIAEAVGLLEPDDWRPGFQADCFCAMRSLFDQGMAIDPVSTYALLVSTRKVEDGMDGLRILTDLWFEVATPGGAMAQIRCHCRSFKEYAIRRRLELVGLTIANKAESIEGPAIEVVNEAEALINEVASIGAENHVVTMGTAVNEACDRIDAAHLRPLGIPTGFHDADEITGGLQKGELTIIAARPSVGKTAMAINLALHVALEQKIPVFFASLEQSRGEIANRALTGLARIDSQKLRLGRLDLFAMGKINEAREVLRNAPIFIDDKESQGIFRISATTRRLAAQNGIGLLLVDYLQIIEPESRREQRHEQVNQVAKRLKALAREVAIPVVALAQLNRSMEEKQRRPRLSDLRESGGIEQAADTVWLMHRPESDEHKNPQLIDIQIAKQRNGPVGEFLLHYHRAWTTFQTPDVFPTKERKRGSD